MRVWRNKCLVIVLALTLASGPVRAARHMEVVANDGRCPAEHTHQDHGTAPHQHPVPVHKSLACCCDCLGCVGAAFVAPVLPITPAALPAGIYYESDTSRLTGFARAPDLGPPRPGMLI